MFEKFEQYITAMIPSITKAQVDLMRTECTMKKIRKKEILLQEGGVASSKIFVVKGLLRNYSVAENGTEYIVRFTDANGWTTDPESYYSGSPSKYNIDAIEPSEVIMFSYQDFEQLKTAIPALGAFSERVITVSATLSQKRLLLNISATPEERYNDFVKSFPNIFHRVPLHMVASYLGLSRKTLTRIRQNLAVGVRGQ